MNPDDFEAVFDSEGGVSAEISTEGVWRIPYVPRKRLLVMEIEVLERMLTAAYGKGREDEAEWTKKHGLT